MAKRVSREHTLAILAAVPKGIRQEVRKVIEQKAGEIVATQKSLVPVKSGDLKKSIRYEMGNVALSSSANLFGTSGKRTKGEAYKGSAGGKIVGDPDLTATIIAGDDKAFYARFVEFGTAPHSLEKGELVTSWVNVVRKGVQFRTRVRRRTKFADAKRHPGSAPHPFFYGPFRASKKRVKSAVSRAIGKAVKAAAKND